MPAYLIRNTLTRLYWSAANQDWVSTLSRASVYHYHSDALYAASFICWGYQTEVIPHTLSQPSTARTSPSYRTQENSHA